MDFRELKSLDEETQKAMILSKIDEYIEKDDSTGMSKFVRQLDLEKLMFLYPSGRRIVFIVLSKNKRNLINALTKTPTSIEHFRESHHLDDLLTHANQNQDVKLLENLDNLVMFTPKAICHCWHTDKTFVTNYIIPKLDPFQFARVCRNYYRCIPHKHVNKMIETTSSLVKNKIFGTCFMMDVYWMLTSYKAIQDDHDVMPTYRQHRMTINLHDRQHYYRNIVSILALKNEQIHVRLWNLVFRFLER